MHYSRIQSLTLDVLSTSELLVSGSLSPEISQPPGIALRGSQNLVHPFMRVTN